MSYNFESFEHASATPSPIHTASPEQLQQEAKGILQQIESGRPQDLIAVNEELNKEMKAMSPKEYGQLLQLIKSGSDADREKNPNLPDVTFTNMESGGTKLTITPKAADSSGPEANPAQTRNLEPFSTKGQHGDTK